MKEYQTLKNEIYDLASLPPDQRKIFETVWNLYEQGPDWDKFSTFWLARVDGLQPKLTRKEIVETPIFKILEDMDSRLAIKQDHARRGDYRDELQVIVDQNFPSRYAFCQTIGLDEGYLSRVLNKRQHISMKKLTQILSTIGYELTIREKSSE